MITDEQMLQLRTKEVRAGLANFRACDWELVWTIDRVRGQLHVPERPGDRERIMAAWCVSRIVDGRLTSAGRQLRQVWKHLTFAMRYSKHMWRDAWVSKLPRRL